ncbi:MAG: cephalosporin hydroxylase family protein [Candidatus Scalindua sp.]
MSTQEDFEKEIKGNIDALGKDSGLKRLSYDWFVNACKHNYCYNFSWLGIPFIQCTQDIIALQEIIWAIKPDMILETGVARGGTSIFFASMLELIGQEGEVVAVDIDIRKHNREKISSHPMSRRIRLLEGSSVEDSISEKVYEIAAEKSSILVCLDSNHTHKHVLRELELYAPLVTVGSYCVVFDTGIEDFPEEMYTECPWGKGNNPKTAIREYMNKTDDFILDREMENKLLVTGAKDGYMKRIRKS